MGNLKLSLGARCRSKPPLGGCPQVSCQTPAAQSGICSCGRSPARAVRATASSSPQKPLIRAEHPFDSPLTVYHEVNGARPGPLWCLLRRQENWAAPIELSAGYSSSCPSLVSDGEWKSRCPGSPPKQSKLFPGSRPQPWDADSVDSCVCGGFSLHTRWNTHPDQVGCLFRALG